MKKATKILCVLLVIIMTAGFSAFSAGAADATQARAISFDANGRLKVMHVTDTHLDNDNIKDSTWLIARACDIEQPDIVVITGDNVSNEDDAAVTKGYIDMLMNVFETRNIPVAVTFGNHDSERGAMSREELMAYYNTYSCSVSVDDGELLSGCGTYYVPVKSSDGKSVKFNLWIFDSNDYDGEGHYGCVLADQVEWYKETSDKLTAENGGKVYSLAFQHIIVDDVYDALLKADRKRAFSFEHINNDGEYYMFNPENQNFGTLNETPCSGYYNYGQFDAMVEKGDVLGIFTGHDHTNAFGVKHKGIDIVNSLSTRYNRDAFSTQYGYRMIEVDESNPSVYTSRVVHWYNMIEAKDTFVLKEAGDEFGSNLAADVAFRGFFQKVFQGLWRSIVPMFTGRQVSYAD